MRSIALASVIALASCAGADELGPNTSASPFQASVSGASVGDDDDDDDGGTGDETVGASDDGEDGEDDPDTGSGAPGDTGADDPPDDPSGVPADDDGGMPLPPAGDCCEPAGLPGCANDPAVEACVCALDDFCCTEQWDESCVVTVGECAPACPGAEIPPGDDSGGDDGGTPANDCCAPTGVPGCGNPFTLFCVCVMDDFCCSVEWDDVCVELATGGCGC